MSPTHPLYRAFCSATGFAGTPSTDPARFSADRLYTTPESASRKRITVHFEATASDTLPWRFEPQQRRVKVLPGETALAFYRAKNVGDKDLIGIATYNMTPEKVSRNLGNRAKQDYIDGWIDCAVLCQSRMFLLRRAEDPGWGRGGLARVLLHRPRYHR